MAESYISALSADFEPDEFSDNYREALEEVIQAKVAGHEITAPAEEPRSTGQVVDLMDALRRSVAEAKTRRGEGGEAGSGAEKESKTSKTAEKKAAKKPAAKTAAKKTTAKKATAKKTAGKKADKTTKKSAARKSA
jgi:DNA end-binding protein Ku